MKYYGHTQYTEDGLIKRMMLSARLVINYLNHPIFIGISNEYMHIFGKFPSRKHVCPGAKRKERVLLSRNIIIQSH